MLMKMIFKNGIGKAACSATAFFLMVIVTFALAGCGETGADSHAKIRIATDILPIADFCRNVGGNLVEVEALIPAGSNPHTYELTTRQMRFLSDADLLVINGLGLAPWTNDIFKSIHNERLIKVVAGEAVPKDSLMAEAEAGGNEAYDPHVWLDPTLVVYMINSIRDGLMAADPGHESIYRQNADDYIGELEGLDALIRRETAGFSSKKFIAFHPSWTYFARRYGLDQVGVIEERPGKEPSAAWIAGLIDSIRSEGIKVVFSEPQFSPRAAEAVAEEAGGGVALEILDPMGDPANPETDSYIALMRHDVQLMGEALK